MKTADISVEYVDHMGSDLDIVNAARVSFDKESDWDLHPEDGDWNENTPKCLSEKDHKLIHYLANHNHWSPFAHTSVKFRIKAPIFVARQLVKHQVGLVWNEVSRRYVDSEPEFYFPKVWRGKPVNVKQGSSGVVSLEGLGSGYWPEHIADKCLSTYNQLLGYGVAPEQARMVLPQNTITEWIWTGSMLAFNRVCKQRLDPHAQEETREVAQGIAKVCEGLFPISWKALMK